MFRGVFTCVVRQCQATGLVSVERSATRDCYDDGLLSAVQGREIGNRPVRPGQATQARLHSSGLPGRQLERSLDREADLHRSFRKDQRPTGSPLTRRKPDQIRVDPDEPRPARRERSSAIGPGFGALAGWLGLRYAAGLTIWIHAVNPARSEWYSNAVPYPGAEKKLQRHPFFLLALV